MYKILANTLFLGKKVIYLPSCHSTNEIAAEMLKKTEDFHGTIIITDFQTKGRGQTGNSWESDYGKNLLFSILLDTSIIPINRQFQLNIATSLGITDFMEEKLDTKLEIKWPNDIYYKGEKVGGILTSTSIRGGIMANAIVGIGLNINQESFSVKNCTSISLIQNRLFNLGDIFSSLCVFLENRYLQLLSQKDDFLTTYYERMYLYKKNHIYFDVNRGIYFKGIIQGIDASGRLIVKEGERELIFHLKEIEFKSPE
ncbi:MAG: biotin--[acetyl-CoA-carboxylase] ligase [Cyclobacteriaceae bacterium]|nr:biotin--[acetyl-CoA-carboxylase] ligase [Cyclobacteriaceae bacterium]